MNKRGDLFMLGLNILFLVAVILLFWKLSVEFRQPNPDEAIGTRQTALMNTYALSEQMLLYIDTAAKFAAYQAVDEVLRKGGLNTISSNCGTYASYELWSSSENECFQTREQLNENFAKELLSVLRGMLFGYPGMPGIAEYFVTISEESNLLVIKASTEDKIELPIVTAKGATQIRAADALLQNRATEISRGVFSADTTLAVTIMPSPNRKPRTSTITHVVVLPSNKEFLADAIDTYKRGSLSTHYLIDVDGKLFQMIPEDQQGEYCRNCTISEDVGIAIAIVGDVLTEVQQDALVNLSAEITRRVGVKPENVLLDKRYGQQAKFVVDITQRAAEQKRELEEQQPEEEETQPEMVVVRPTESNVVTSCWGDRPGIGDGFHDGIDFRGNGEDVYAFADGVIHDLCRNGNRCLGGYGNNLIIEHPLGIFSRYNHLASIPRGLEPGDGISRGEIIGTVGSTGATEAPHLDFKIYVSRDTGADKGVNPLCFFSEQDLGVLEKKPNPGNCAKYRSTFSRSDPRLARECKDIKALGADVGCFANAIPIDVGGSKEFTATLTNIDRQSGVMNAIIDGASEQNIDVKLALAIITQETCIHPIEQRCGTANLVSFSGCAGLGQFCGGTAKSPPYDKIFGEGVITCDCPGENSACTAHEARCASDPRFDPLKSAKAISLHLRTDMNKFKGKKDAVRFAIGSYNGGSATINLAIARTLKTDPSWEEVAAVLDHSVIAEVCAKYNDLCYDSVAKRQRKADEIKTYVERVSGYYVGQGGKLSGSFSDQFCPDQQLKVKELGRYAFKPSFTVEIPDLLEPAEQLTAWAESVYGKCVGEGDNRACLRDEVATFNARQNDVSIVSCVNVEGHNLVTTRFRQLVEDCRANQQDECFCLFNPNRPLQDVQVRLYENNAHVFIDGNPVGGIPVERPYVHFSENPEEEPKEVIAALEVTNGKQRIVVYEGQEHEGEDNDPFSRESETYEIDRDAFLNTTIDTTNLAADVYLYGVYKRNDTLVWIADPGEATSCPVYKTHHHVCANFSRATYRLDQGKTTIPVVKFALYLRDDHDPEPVENIAAQEKTGLLDQINPALGAAADAVAPQPVDLSFDASPSDDVSYYMVDCAGMDEPLKILGRRYDQFGRDHKIPRIENEQVTCIGPEGGKLIEIIPFDIAGNEGDAAQIVAEPAASPENLGGLVN